MPMGHRIVTWWRVTMRRMCIRECSVCLERIEVNDNKLTTPCGHVYHKGCIDGWALKCGDDSVPCPLCRAPTKNKKADCRMLWKV